MASHFPATFQPDSSHKKRSLFRSLLQISQDPHFAPFHPVPAPAPGAGAVGVIAFLITGGQEPVSRQLQPLMDIPLDTTPLKSLLADAGYDSDANREVLLRKGVSPVINPKPKRKTMLSFHKTAYRNRNWIERILNRISQFRRIATVTTRQDHRSRRS